MLKITNNREAFYQWDIGQSLTVELAEGETVTEVHIGNEGCKKYYVVEPIEGLVAVYDELLQSGKKVIAYEYIKSETDGHTIRKNVFGVWARPKATDYAYTPTESYSWEYWSERAKLYAETAQSEVASIPTKMAEWWSIHKPEIVEEIKTEIPPYDDTEIRAEINGIQQELNDKMEFYKLDTQVSGSNVTFYHDGVQLDFDAISEKYFDDKYFVYAECLDLTFIPCFPPTETDQAIEFISTYIYGGEVMVDRLIINSNNEGKFEEKYIAEKSEVEEIATEITDVKESLNQLEDTTKDLTNGNSNLGTLFEFTHGSWNSETYDSWGYRVRSAGAMYFESTLTVNISSGLRFFVYEVNDSLVRTRPSGWVYSYTFDRSKKYVVTIARIVDDTSETVSIAEFSNSLKFVTPTTSKINNVELQTEHNTKNTYSIYTSNYTYGWINADGSVRERAEQKDYFTSDYVFVKNGESFKYRLKHAVALPIVCKYAERGANNGTPIITGSSAYIEGIYTATEDCYLRFCWHTSCTDGYVRFTECVPDNVKAYIKPISNHNEVNTLNILCLGDSIFGNDGEICEYLREFTQATIYNGGLGGTSVSTRSSTTDNYRYFDGQNIVDAITSRNFAPQDAVISTIPTTYYANTLAMLKSLDMSKIDLVTLAWGTNDYTQGKTIAQIQAGLNDVVNTFHQRCPHIRLLILTPIWRYFDDGDGDTKVYNVSTLKEIAKAIEEWAKDRRISVLNGYENMPLDNRNKSTYFDSGSQVHLNAKGNKMYAHLINGKIQSLY